MSSKATNRPRSTQASSNAGSSNIKVEKSSAPKAWSNPPPNAWSRPLKTRPPPGLGQPVGMPAIASQNGAPAANPVLRERFLHLALSLVGQRVAVTYSDGTVLEGIFHTATPFADLPPEKKNRVVLKAVQLVQGDNKKIPNGSTVVVPTDRVVSIHCKSLRLGNSNGKGEGFRTDTEISSNQSDKGRELVAAGSAWTTGGTIGKTSRADALLADSPRKPSAGLKGNIGEWDQFRANKELFNVDGGFDENIYTTELDKSTIDSAKIKEAERLAREIESTASSNIHIADERNQTILGDYDEEDRYSGVLTEKLQARCKDPSPAKTAMNYAAAAAKAGATKSEKAEPPGFTVVANDDPNVKVIFSPPDDQAKSEIIDELKLDAVIEPETVEHSPEQDELKTPESEETPLLAEKEAQVEASVSENNIMEPETVADKGEAEERNTEDLEAADTATTKVTTKLNANAKEFEPAGNSFKPSFVMPAPVVLGPTHIPQQMIDPNTGALMHPHVPGQQHYMHPMGHPAMMQMMNQQFAHMRYSGGYPGMEQPLPHGQMLSHPQHMQQQQPQLQPPKDNQQQAPPAGDEHQQIAEAGSLTAPQQQQQSLDPQGQHSPHPGVPVPYPPNASPYLYGGAMPMHRGPGNQMGVYHPHMGAGPHQIPVAQANSFRHMYGMPQPIPQIRGPNGAPYYQSVPPHYPPYMAGDGDDYRGSGRGGRGAGRGRRGGRKAGRVGPGRGYQSWNASLQNGGQFTLHNASAEDSNASEQHASTLDEPPPAASAN